MSSAVYMCGCTQDKMVWNVCGMHRCAACAGKGTYNERGRGRIGGWIQRVCLGCGGTGRTSPGQKVKA